MHRRHRLQVVISIHTGDWSGTRRPGHVFSNSGIERDRTQEKSISARSVADLVAESILFCNTGLSACSTTVVEERGV
jgi:3-mercaptopyruvate sulfurtransferase SseA